jgi:hypothetical protein
VRAASRRPSSATARPRQTPEDTADWLSRERETAPGRLIPIGVGVLSDCQAGNEGRRAFYLRFVQIVLKKIDPRLYVEDKLVTNFDSLYDQLRNPDSTYRLRVVVGVSESRFRRFRFGIDFVPIPGLDFRLFCLVRQDLIDRDRLSWRRVVRAPQSGDDRIRVLAIEGEIGETFPVEECGFQGEKNMFLQRPPLDFRTVADKFLRMLEEDEANQDGTISALICGEEWASNIRLHAEEHVALGDLAALAGAEVPSHREALAVQGTDEKWKQELSRATKDLFVDPTLADELGDCYADYLRAMIKENPKGLKAALASQESVPLPIHFRLRLFDLPVGEKFRERVEGRLRNSNLHDWVPNEADHKTLLDRLLPWKAQARGRITKLNDEVGCNLLLQHVKDVVGEEEFRAFAGRPRKSARE